MRALPVVDGAPVVEGMLGVHQVDQRCSLQHLDIEGAMEALVLALGLRVIGPRVTDPDALAHQPQVEPGVVAPIASPRRAIVHRHPHRQPIAPERRGQVPDDEITGLRTAGLQHQGIAGVIVEHGEGVATPAVHRHVPLEVHLPQVVGRRMFEALPGPGGLRGRRRDQAMPSQYRMHRADSRHRMSQHLQPTRQLACAPCRMLGPERNDVGLERLRTAARHVMRSPGAIG